MNGNPCIEKEVGTAAPTKGLGMKMVKELCADLLNAVEISKQIILSLTSSLLKNYWIIKQLMWEV